MPEKEKKKNEKYNEQHKYWNRSFKYDVFFHSFWIAAMFGFSFYLFVFLWNVSMYFFDVYIDIVPSRCFVWLISFSSFSWFDETTEQKTLMCMICAILLSGIFSTSFWMNPWAMYGIDVRISGNFYKMK